MKRSIEDIKEEIKYFEELSKKAPLYIDRQEARAVLLGLKRELRERES